MKYAILLALLATGCAAKKPQQFSYGVPRGCLKHAEVTKDSRCTIVAPGKMRCDGVEVTYAAGCEQLSARQQFKK